MNPTGRIARLRRRLLAPLLVAGLLVGGTAAASVERWVLPGASDEVFTLLLLGSDLGPPRSGVAEEGNADGFQLLFVSADRRAATFVSIPRDSWVTVPGLGDARINTCLFEGPQRCVATVESEFGITVDGYLLTTMRGFTRGVERFGGIDVEVPRPLVVGGTSVAPGPQRLDGPEALVYARDRMSRAGGDFARSAAQAELLAQAHRQVVEDGSPRAVFAALRLLRQGTVTDLSGPQLTRLGFEALRLDPAAVGRELAPARVGTVGAASVVFLEDRAYAIVADAAQDGRVG